MATPKQAHTLVSHFDKRFAEHYGIKPLTNRNKARWGFDSMLMDLSMSEVTELIDYYFKTAGGAGHDHSLEWFFYNYEKLVEAKKRDDAQREEDARLRAISEQRAREWKEKNGRL